MEDQSTTIQVDSSGDLSLIAEHKDDTTKATITKTFVVSSKALCLASPVWKAMFDPLGPWTQPSSSKDGFRMPEDNPEALLILLDAAHLNFDRIPATVCSAQLLQLAILCDKYDAVRLIRPWVSSWINCLQSEWATPSSGKEHWLFISWAFGYEPIYSKLAKYLVTSVTVNGEGQCLNQKGEVLGDGMPPEAIENILEARESTVEALLQLCRREVDLYIQSPRVCQGYEGPAFSGITGETPTYAQECDALVLGSLMRGLQKIGLWPIPEFSDDVNMSVSVLGEKLRTMTCHAKMVSGCNVPARPAGGPFASPFSSTFGGSTSSAPFKFTEFGHTQPPNGGPFAPKKAPVIPTVTPETAHEKCVFTTTFRTDVQRILNDMQIRVFDTHRAHLTEQERKRTMVLLRD